MDIPNIYTLLPDGCIMSPSGRKFRLQAESFGEWVEDHLMTEFVIDAANSLLAARRGQKNGSD
jgi:hypothetical protein